MRRDRKHTAGAIAAFLAALALLFYLFVATGETASTAKTIAVLALTGLCTAVFVIELVLAASVARPAPKLKTAQMVTPASLRADKPAADES